MEASVQIVQSPLRIRVAPEEVTIRHWGLRDQPFISWLNFLLAAGASAFVGMYLGNEVWGWGILLVFVVTLWPIWIPMRFEIGPHGITRVVLGRKTRAAWTSI